MLDLLQEAETEIKYTWGDRVSFSSKHKTLSKFGENEAVGTAPQTIMTLPSGEVEETFVASNLITHIASTSGSDTNSVLVEGHTFNAGGSLAKFVVQNVTLAGQTKTALSTPIARVSRVKELDGTKFVGTVYVAQDVTFTSGVPQTASAIHIMVKAGLRQSQKAQTTISNKDYWGISKFSVSMLERANSSGILSIEHKPITDTDWLPLTPTLGVSDNIGTVQFDCDPWFIVPSNSDVRLVGTANTSGIYMAGGMRGRLALVTG